MTQEELAARCLVTPKTIARYETGRAVPRRKTLKLLVEALGCDGSELHQPPGTSPALGSLFELAALAALREAKVVAAWSHGDRRISIITEHADRILTFTFAGEARPLSAEDVEALRRTVEHLAERFRR